MAETKSSSKADDKAPKTRKPRAAAQADADKKPARKSAAKSNGDSTAEKKPGRRAAAKAVPGRPQMSAEERYRMVEVAAYYIAERDRFAGSPVEYWTQAEAQISGMLGE